MWSPLPHKQSMTPHSPNTHTRAQEQGVAVRATLHHLPFRILTTARAPASPSLPLHPHPGSPATCLLLIFYSVQTPALDYRHLPSHTLPNAPFPHPCNPHLLISHLLLGELEGSPGIA